MDDAGKVRVRDGYEVQTGARLTWHITSSLDGYIAPADNDLRWSAPYVGPNPLAHEIVADIGAILMGHTQYANAIREEGRVYGGMWRGPMIVLTHADPASAEEGFEFVNGLELAARRARDGAGTKRVIVMGASTAHQCIRAGFLDEILVHTVPVLLGGGLRMFDGWDGEPVRLTRMKADITPTAVNSWYRVDPA